MAVSTASRPTGAPVVSWEKVQQRLRPSSSRKNNPLLIVAIIAMVLLALTGLWRATHQAASGQMVKAMAARKDIPAGARLSFAMISFLDVPKQFATSDMATSLNDVSGRIARTYIPAGEPIRSYMIFSGKDGLSVNLDTRERAITLQLDDDALVDHSIMPDDRVDLLVVSNKEGKKYTKTICQDLRVLMAAPKEQTFSRGAGTSTNKVTLAVSPSTAEAITEAVETGKIRLILRNRLNIADESLAGSKPADLLPLGIEKTAAPQPATASLLPPPPAVAPDIAQSSPLQWMVEVISGNQKETYGVPEK